jgi:hypothetical protein
MSYETMSGDDPHSPAQAEAIRLAVLRDAARGAGPAPWILLSAGILGARLGFGRLLGDSWREQLRGLLGAGVVAAVPIWFWLKNRQRARYVRTLSTADDFVDYYRAQKQEEVGNLRRLLWLLVLMVLLFVPLALLLPRLTGPLPPAPLPPWIVGLACLALWLVFVVWAAVRMRRAARILAALAADPARR